MKKALILERRIFVIRGRRVMLDDDLAKLYGVPTKALNQQVKRNAKRFPEDFAFQLTRNEGARLKSQFVTSNTGRGGRRKPHLVFTEHGAVMLASVLNSPIAVQASIQVVKAFIRLREMMAANSELALRLEDLERKCDVRFKAVFDTIRQLMEHPDPPHERIGFHSR